MFDWISHWDKAKYLPRSYWRFYWKQLERKWIIKKTIYTVAINNAEKPGFQLGIAKDFSPDVSGLKYTYTL